jgi:hypothetical protein
MGSMNTTLTAGNDFIDLKQARALLPGGRANISTLWRWALQGWRGVKLQYVRVGRTVYTTPAWLEQFQRDCAALDQPSTSTPPQRRAPARRSPSRRQSQIEAAEARLANSGFAN